MCTHMYASCSGCYFSLPLLRVYAVCIWYQGSLYCGTLSPISSLHVQGQSSLSSCYKQIKFPSSWYGCKFFVLLFCVIPCGTSQTVFRIALQGLFIDSPKFLLHTE